MSNEGKEMLYKEAEGLESPGAEQASETRGFQLTEEIFKELHAAEDTPERIVQLLDLSPGQIRSALSGQQFSEGEKQCLRELLEAAEAFDKRGKVSSLSETLDDLLVAVLHRLHVPTRDEIYTLTQKVEELNLKLENLKLGVTPTQGEATQGAKPTVTVAAPNTVVRADS